MIEYNPEFNARPTAHDLVADAVQRSVWRQIEYPFRNFLEDGMIPETEMNSLTGEYTANKCREGCELALGLLAQKDPKGRLFDFYAVVSSYEIHWGTDSLLHSFFVVRSDGVWYGASPSNMCTDPKQRELAVYSGSLQSVLWKLEWTLPVARFIPWPDARLIQNVADSSELIIPILKRRSYRSYTYDQTCLHLDRMGPFQNRVEIRTDTLRMDRVNGGGSHY